MKYVAVILFLMLRVPAEAQQKAWAHGKEKVVLLDNHFNNEQKQDASGRLVRHHYTWDDTTMGGFSILGSIFLEKEKNNTSTHDLGFMMYCSFGNANIIAPKPEYKDILINCARSLATRFNPVVGCIKSWDSKTGDFLVIIDNMMNLELLFWAARVTGDTSLYNIAVTHANTTMKNHFRGDNSSYHVLNYNPSTGGVNEKKTAQGYSDESA